MCLLTRRRKGVGSRFSEKPLSGGLGFVRKRLPILGPRLQTPAYRDAANSASSMVRMVIVSARGAKKAIKGRGNGVGKDMTNLLAIISKIRSQGRAIWAENEDLLIEVHRGLLTGEDTEILTRHKADS